MITIFVAKEKRFSHNRHMRLQIQLHKILGIILKIIKFKLFNIFFKSHLLSTLYIYNAIY
jgi:hypothetical protein